MKKVKVFLDANIVIAEGKSLNGPQLARVFDLVRADRITVLTTDLTILEIARHHTENDFKKIKEICRPSSREILEEIYGVQLQNIDQKELKRKLFGKYRSLVEEMFQDKMRASILTINNVTPSDVFFDYSYGNGFFADGAGKKNQFQDSFVFKCLKQETSGEESVIIVSKDRDFVQPVVDQQNYILVKSLSGLFYELGLKIEDPEIEDFLEHHDAEIAVLVGKDLSDWTLHGDIEDSEIHVEDVYSIEFQEIIAFKSAEEGKPILIVGSLNLIGTAYISHPDWDTEIWDSEEKNAIPIHTVSAQVAIECKVDVSLSVEINEYGTPVDIQELSIQDICDDDIILNPDFDD